MSQPEVTQVVLQNGTGAVASDTSDICCSIGTCSLGTVGTKYKLKGPSLTQVRSGLGYGPLAEDVAAKLALGKEVWAVPTAKSVTGTKTDVSHSGTGTATMTVTGEPNDKLNVKVKVVSSTKISYSLDAGVTYTQAVLLLGSTRAYTMPGTGLSVALGSSGTLVADDIYSFTTEAPVGSLAERLAGIDAALAGSAQPGFLHLVGAQVYAAATEEYIDLGDVTQSGTGPAITLSGTPVAEGEITIEVTTAGAPGTGVVKYRLTHAGDWVTGVTIPTTPFTYVLGASGVTATFENDTFVLGETYTADMTTVDAVPSSVAVEFAAVDAKMTAAFAAKKPTFTVIDLPDEADATIDAEVETLESSQGRILLARRYFWHTSVLKLAGATLYKRSNGVAVSNQITLCEIHEDLGKVSLGALPQVASIIGDESETPGVARVESLRTFPRKGGYFCNSDTDGNMCSAPGSDFLFAQHRRVMDRACQLAYDAGIWWLNKELLVDTSTGLLTSQQADGIESDINRKVTNGLLGNVSGVQILVDREEPMLETKTLKVYVNITPFAYAKTIVETLSITLAQ
jgi:hypothetical protein